MKMDIGILLQDEITDRIEKLGEMEAGTEKYKTAVDEITKLTDRLIEIEKLDVEQQDKDANREIEIMLKREQMDEERKDRRMRNGITIGGIVLPLAVTVWGALKSWKFEETGTITTTMGRGFINKLLPKK